MATKTGIAYWDKKLIGQNGVLNQYVKWRDAIAVEDGKPICACITCGKRIAGTNLHAGHWISRRHKATAYNEFNLHAQCGFPCNKFRNGEPQIYERKLRQLYGDELVDDMLQSVGSIRKWKPFELEALYHEYRRALKFMQEVRTKSLT